MSAIVAFASPRPDSRETAWLEEATRLSRRAGPGGSEHVHLGRAGLGHALLQTGGDRQGPLSLDGGSWISAVARLDARRELAGKLRQMGAPAAEADDDSATLLLRAYAVWGEDLVEHVGGDFAFALWDSGVERLICARDQLGVVPLHYALGNQHLLVASVPDAILAHPAVSDELDPAAILDFLARGAYTSHDATAFRDIRQLRPAHRLIWSADGVRLERYWRLPERPRLRLFKRIDEASEALQEQLGMAVADRLPAGRVATQLSGGMDSTSIAATGARLLGARKRDLKAFSTQRGPQSGDREGELATEVAASLGLPVEVVDASRRTQVDPFTRPEHPTPEPIPFRFADTQHHLASLQADWATVSLSGHGGDALLATSPWYWAEWVLTGDWRLLAGGLGQWSRFARGKPILGPRTLLHTVRRTRAPAELPPWLVASSRERAALNERSRSRHLASALDPRFRDARSFIHSPVWASEFRRGDPSFTGLGVRFRFPFADLRLIELIRSLAPDPWLVDKRILREAMSGRLPESVQRRPKTPLGNPPPAGADPEGIRAAARLVMEAPGLDRFIDRRRLRDELLARGSAGGPEQHARSRALGLAHWLWHRG